MCVCNDNRVMAHNLYGTKSNAHFMPHHWHVNINTASSA